MKNWYQHFFIPITTKGKKLRVLGTLIIASMLMIVLSISVQASSALSIIIILQNLLT